MLEIDGHVFHLSAGDAFFIPSGKISYCAADLNDPWCYTWISFLGINAPMYLCQLMSASRETYLFHHLDTEKYRLLIGQILKMKGSAPEEYFKGNGLLLQILGELFRDTKFDEQNWEKLHSR